MGTKQSHLSRFKEPPPDQAKTVEEIVSHEETIGDQILLKN
ncbi:MAG: hypothetical protein R6U68_12435 [Desulfobacteraceae bacterium]